VDEELALDREAGLIHVRAGALGIATSA
jgi:hypothetical protein